MLSSTFRRIQRCSLTVVAALRRRWPGALFWFFGSALPFGAIKPLFLHCPTSLLSPLRRSLITSLAHHHMLSSGRPERQEMAGRGRRLASVRTRPEPASYQNAVAHANVLSVCY